MTNAQCSGDDLQGTGCPLTGWRGYFIASPVQNRQFVRFGIFIPNRGLFHEHGQRGSQSMTLRRKEKKRLMPVLLTVQG